MRELVCAAEEAAEHGLPSPSTTPTGGVRLEPARPVGNLLHDSFPLLDSARPSSVDLEEWCALASRHASSSSSEDNDSCSSPSARMVSKADNTDFTPPPQTPVVALSPAAREDSENIDKPGRRVQFSCSSPRVQLIPACAGAIRRPGKRHHRRRQLSTASLTAMHATLAQATS